MEPLGYLNKRLCEEVFVSMPFHCHIFTTLRVGAPEGIQTAGRIRVAFPVSGAIVVQMGYYAVETVDAVD